MRPSTLCCALALLLAATVSLSGAAKPNIVLFYADDLGYTDLGAQGSEFYESPHIDRIAREGLTFTQAYAGAANCAPSRACLMTGLYTPRHGIYTVGNSDRGAAKHRKLVPVGNTTILGKDFPTLASTLRTAGYRTCVAGKWHLSEDPTEYGFEANFGGNTAGHPKSYFSPYKNKNLPDGPKGEHLPERLGREVSGWIRDTQTGKDPFFVYFPFYSVHTPIQAPAELTATFEKKKTGPHHDHAKYAAMIKSMDDAVGRVLDTLDELDLAGNTIVIFTSDNGPHGKYSNAKPLRGSKGMFYEGGIREPFFIRWPGTIKAGAKNDTPIHQIDLYPTLCTVTGATTPELLDGVSLLPVLTGSSLPARSLFWHFPAYLQSYKPDPDCASPHFRTTPCGVVREGDWKLIEYFEDDTVELYNLATDPSERTNLAAGNPDKRDWLLGELHKWRDRTKAPMPTPKTTP